MAMAMGVQEGVAHRADNRSVGAVMAVLGENPGTDVKLFAAAAFNASINRLHLVQSQPPKGVKPKAGIV
jgi:hypothetical protein